MESIIQFAYIDPGTGSMIFQGLAAIIMGVLVGFQSVRAWFFNLFQRFFGKADQSSEGVSDDSSSSLESSAGDDNDSL